MQKFARFVKFANLKTKAGSDENNWTLAYSYYIKKLWITLFILSSFLRLSCPPLWRSVDQQTWITKDKGGSFLKQRWQERRYITVNIHFYFDFWSRKSKIKVQTFHRVRRLNTRNFQVVEKFGDLMFSIHLGHLRLQAFQLTIVCIFLGRVIQWIEGGKQKRNHRC